MIICFDSLPRGLHLNLGMTMWSLTNQWQSELYLRKPHPSVERRYTELYPFSKVLFIVFSHLLLISSSVIVWLPVAKTNSLYLDYTRWVTTEKHILFVECVKASINHTLGAPTGWLFVCFCSSIFLKLWKLTPPTLPRTIFILPWEFETVASYTITIPVITIIPDKWYFLESNFRQTALTWRMKQNSVGQRKQC